MKAFLDKLYLCDPRLDDYVDILEWVANGRNVLCRLKADICGKVQDFHTHSLEIHSVSGKPSRTRILTLRHVLRFSEKNKML